MTLRAIFSIVILCSLSGICSASQEFFPFLAEAKADKINVRAGQSENFERVYQLNMKEDVVVVAHQFSWYKIILPSGAESFISSKYVQLINPSLGKLTADKVNVRARADTKSAILGQTMEGELVYILASLEGWYKIKPIGNSHGWVADNLLTFKSNQTESYLNQRLAQITREEVGQPQVAEESLSLETSQPAIEESREVDLVGRVSISEETAHVSRQYIFTGQDQQKYYLHGMDHVLNGFVGDDVRVKGIINSQPGDQLDHPAIEISEILLVL